MNATDHNFVLCIDSGGSDDLEVRKVYETIPDENAARDGYLRVVDESGEDYLYPSDLFSPIELTKEVRDNLMSAA
ncbi:MAG: hypothetical protein ACK4S4_14200 [Pyrinomonadaceae bacterium]